jgi:hypothetical protein
LHRSISGPVQRSAVGQSSLFVDRRISGRKAPMD